MSKSVGTQGSEAPSPEGDSETWALLLEQLASLDKLQVAYEALMGRSPVGAMQRAVLERIALEWLGHRVVLNRLVLGRTAHLAVSAGALVPDEPARELKHGVQEVDRACDQLLGSIAPSAASSHGVAWLAWRQAMASHLAALSGIVRPALSRQRQCAPAADASLAQTVRQLHARVLAGALSAWSSADAPEDESADPVG